MLFLLFVDEDIVKYKKETRRAVRAPFKDRKVLGFMLEKFVKKILNDKKYPSDLVKRLKGDVCLM